MDTAEQLEAKINKKTADWHSEIVATGQRFRAQIPRVIDTAPTLTDAPSAATTTKMEESFGEAVEKSQYVDKLMDLQNHVVDTNEAYQHIPGVLPSLEVTDMASHFLATHKKHYSHVEDWHSESTPIRIYSCEQQDYELSDKTTFPDDLVGRDCARNDAKENRRRRQQCHRCRSLFRYDENQYAMQVKCIPEMEQWIFRAQV